MSQRKTGLFNSALVVYRSPTKIFLLPASHSFEASKMPEPSDKRGRGRGQGRDVQISKALSLLLRHAAEKEGLKMNAQGYANVTDVVCAFQTRLP